MSCYIQKIFEDPRFFVPLTLLTVFSVCCHEFCHAYAALRMGDPTAADNGHLTLNPMKQMGWISLVMLALIGISWGCVPVNRARMRGKYAGAVVALAGPVCNLLLGTALSVLSVVVARYGNPQETESAGMLLRLLFFAGTMNFFLFFINILPLPGLDGHAVVREFFPRYLVMNSEFGRGAALVAVLLVFMFSGRLYEVAYRMTYFLVSAILRIWQGA